ncbi:MAG: hypothetical protein R3F18_08715 [Lysobacterales bacterium]
MREPRSARGSNKIAATIARKNTDRLVSRFQDLADIGELVTLNLGMTGNHFAQGADQLGACRVAASVQDTWKRVCSFAAQRQSAIDDVELHPK